MHTSRNVIVSLLRLILPYNAYYVNMHYKSYEIHLYFE